MDKTLQIINDMFGEVENYQNVSFSKSTEVSFDLPAPGHQLSDFVAFAKKLNLRLENILINGASDDDAIVTGINVSFTMTN